MHQTPKPRWNQDRLWNFPDCAINVRQKGNQFKDRGISACECRQQGFQRLASQHASERFVNKMLRLLGIPPKLISTKGNLRLLFVKWRWPGTILLTVMAPPFVNNHLPIHALYMKGLGSQQNSNYLWMNSIFYSLMLDGIDSC
jgi:hypothetical protein